jgi:hemerythrin-like domain-containing protein
MEVADMAQTKKSASKAKKTSSKRKRAPRLPEALAMLQEDHRKVQKMFKQFKKLNGDSESKQALVEEACWALSIHAQLEEEVFYPALRAALDESDLLDEAEVEHDVAKELIAKLESMGAEDEQYDATFTVLGEYVNHHIEEEEKEMFPKAKRAKMDMDALAEEMDERKESLQRENEEPAPPRSRSGRSRQDQPRAR